MGIITRTILYMFLAISVPELIYTLTYGRYFCIVNTLVESCKERGIHDSLAKTTVFIIMILSMPANIVVLILRYILRYIWLGIMTILLFTLYLYKAFIMYRIRKRIKKMAKSVSKINLKNTDKIDLKDKKQ